MRMFLLLEMETKVHVLRDVRTYTEIGKEAIVDDQYNDIWGWISGNPILGSGLLMLMPIEIVRV